MAGEMAQALALAARGPWPDPNPRVGCVLVATDGQQYFGYHLGHGTPHAEAVALAAAGPAARGATVYVTLEPCNHHGRTAPCSQALIAAQVAKVVYAQADPNPKASGGAETLAAAGIEVVHGELSEEAAELNREWAKTVASQRPYLVAKIAGTLDGYAAAPDATSQWITGPKARQDVHRERSRCDALLIGTGTVLADDPELTVRDHDGPSPTRIVIGRRPLPATAKVLVEPPVTRQFATHDLLEVLSELFADGFRRAYLEGGPTLLAAFLTASLVDELHVYLAPKLLGAGRPLTADLGSQTIGDALDWRLLDVTRIADDVKLTLRPKAEPCLLD